MRANRIVVRRAREARRTSASLFAAVLNPGTPYAALAYKELAAAAIVANVELRAFEVRSPEEIGPQLEASKAAGAGGLAILEDPLTFSQRTEIAASRLHGLRVVSQFDCGNDESAREFARFWSCARAE